MSETPKVLHECFGYSDTVENLQGVAAEVPDVCHSLCDSHGACEYCVLMIIRGVMYVTLGYGLVLLHSLYALAAEVGLILGMDS